MCVCVCVCVYFYLSACLPLVVVFFVIWPADGLNDNDDGPNDDDVSARTTLDTRSGPPVTDNTSMYSCTLFQSYIHAYIHSELI